MAEEPNRRHSRAEKPIEDPELQAVLVALAPLSPSLQRVCREFDAEHAGRFAGATGLQADALSLFRGAGDRSLQYALWLGCWGEWLLEHAREYHNIPKHDTSRRHEALRAFLKQLSRFVETKAKADAFPLTRPFGKGELNYPKAGTPRSYDAAVTGAVIKWAADEMPEDGWRIGDRRVRLRRVGRPWDSTELLALAKALGHGGKDASRKYVSRALKKKDPFLQQRGFARYARETWRLLDKIVSVPPDVPPE